jgi:hypothetical protein
MAKLQVETYLNLRKEQLNKFIDFLNNKDNNKLAVCRELEMISVLAFLGYEIAAIILLEYPSLAEKIAKPAKTLANFLHINQADDDLAILTFMYANRDFVDDCLDLLKE